VVLDLLSDSAFIGSSDEGLPITVQSGSDCKYHFEGILNMAPGTVIKKVLSDCDSVANAMGCMDIILLALMPRYISSRC
jgi:hypothetical protein